MWKLLAAAATAATIGSSAQAATVVIDVTGEIDTDNGVEYDHTGVFGSIGSLLGQSVAMSFVFDTAAGDAAFCSADPADCEHYYGGDAYGSLPSIGSATVTINGHSVTVPGAYMDSLYRYDYDYIGYDQLVASVWDSGNGISHIAEIYLLAYADLLPDSIFTPFSLTDFSGFDSHTSWFQIYDPDRWATAHFTLTSLTVTVDGVGPSPVPLPASLPLLGAALAALLGLRRGRLWPGLLPRVV